MKNILSQWEQCRKVADPAADECTLCRQPFATGDVSLLFGDLEAPAPVRRLYCCATCSQGGLEKGMIPSATMVYVQNEHRGKDFEQLEPAVQDRFAEALSIVDRIHRGVEEWIKRNQKILPGPTS